MSAERCLAPSALNSCPHPYLGPGKPGLAPNPCLRGYNALIMTDPDKLAYWLLKDINKAIRDYDMVQDGDRIGVALSGGKDSLSLLRLLDLRRRRAPQHYELVALHVLGDSHGPHQSPHPPLLDWLAGSGYEYVVAPMIIPEDEALPMDCQRCSWNRRRTLFQLFREQSCNVIAFGHHADDLAETTLLNLLYSGKLETMAPRRDYFEGQLRLIRPLAYTPEKDLRRLARASGFPSPPPACERSDQNRREMARQAIRQAEKLGKHVRANLLRAGLRGNREG